MRALACACVALWLGGCACGPAARQSALDEAYLQGASDAAKQLYWAKQALEAPGAGRPAGSIRYYEWEQSAPAADGRRLAPETVAVPVFIPSPAPASQSP